jgi:hypothetical protein
VDCTGREKRSKWRGKMARWGRRTDLRSRVLPQLLTETFGNP